jgi:hypothetical protein
MKATLLPGQKHPVPLDTRLGVRQGQFGRFEEQKNLLSLSESNPDFLVVQPIG